MSSTSALWHDARHPPKDPTDLSFKDKAVLVTGAHGAGLGHHAAIKYAALGANPLILAVRTQEKGEAAKTAIIQKTNCSPEIFIIETVDLASFDSVHELAHRIINNKSIPRLHVVQLAAGVAPWSYAKCPPEPSVDGGEHGNDAASSEYELSLKVDVLSHGLLALLLLPKLHEAAAAEPPSSLRPHLSFLDSIAIFEVPLDILPPYPRPADDNNEYQTITQRLDDAKKWNPIHQYFLIKLATWYIAKGVADLVTNNEKFSGVIVNATCPGLCNTNMTSGLPWAYRVFMAIRYFFLGRTAEMGARTLVSATGLGPESHGKFWNNDRFHE